MMIAHRTWKMAILMRCFIIRQTSKPPLANFPPLFLSLVPRCLPFFLPSAPSVPNWLWGFIFMPHSEVADFWEANILARKSANGSHYTAVCYEGVKCEGVQQSRSNSFYFYKGGETSIWWFIYFRTARTGLYFWRGLKMTKSITATVAKALFGIIRISQSTNF
jgi:hypothetical protein